MLLRLVAFVLCLPAAGAAQTLTSLLVPAASEEAAYTTALSPADSAESPRAFARLYADGALRSGVSGGSDAATATGSLGVQLALDAFGLRTDATVLISIVGAADSVQADYARTLIAPASGSTLNAGLIDTRFHDVLFGLDLRLYGSASTSEWSVPVGPDGLFDPMGPPQPFTAGSLGAGVLLGETLLSGTIAGSTTVGVTLDAGVAVRTLFGDIVSDDFDPLRQSLLGDTDTVFIGPEAGLHVQINGVKAGITTYWFGDDIRGFGNGQVVAGIGIQTPLVSGALVPTTGR
ncbi:MAG: hypothetical protein CMM84_02765 [Rhodothermaceae bacterium]|nr:hypothetical protein [Rhodothermaceae bacterium]